MGTELIISFEIEGLHRWPNAPAEYEEFRNLHKHLFKFICWYPVTINPAKNYADRPVELYELRQQTIEQVKLLGTTDGAVTNFGDWSCEGIAQGLMLMNSFSKVFVGEEYWLGALVS